MAVRNEPDRKGLYPDVQHMSPEDKFDLTLCVSVP